ARMLARRVLRMRDELHLDVTLQDLAEHHLDVNLDGHLNKQHREGLLTILELEEERYAEMLRKGKNVIVTQFKSVGKDASEIPDEILFTLNDSHGLAPDIVVNLARDAGWKSVVLRTGFNAEMAERHAKLAKDAAKTTESTNTSLDVSAYPATETSYYDDVYETKFKATVLDCRSVNGGDGPEGATYVVVLDKSHFYPEGGGQEGDHGVLVQGEARVSVIDTQSSEGVILHYIDGALSTEQSVSGEVDWVRRKQLMDHHTAVHIVGGAARRLLGPHIFQAGSHLSVDSGRLDITHYHRLSREDLDAIETMSNRILAQVRNTEKSELNRKDADLEHGFDLYQGGAPKGDSIRILKIADHDTQACGGTHHDEPGQIGSIRLVRSTAVQDGVERLHIVAGDAALTYARAQDELVRSTSEVFGIHASDLPKTAERFFSEWKDQRKQIEHLEAEIVRLRTSGGGNDTADIDGVRIVIMEVDGDLKAMTKMLKELTLDVNNPTLAILGSKDGGGKLMVAVTDGSAASERYNAVDMLRLISPHIKGGGGGRPTLAQGGGSHPEGLGDALQAAKDHLGL
ncbi:MAG: alanine--tRNA ligase-related protein, partial [Poseidonia sp.]